MDPWLQSHEGIRKNPQNNGAESSSVFLLEEAYEELKKTWEHYIGQK